MKHIIQTIKLVGIEARLVTTKVLDILAAPYWKLYNELTNRDFRRNPAKYTGDARTISEQIATADLAQAKAIAELNHAIGTEIAR